MRRKLFVCASLVGLALTTQAHHSFSMFNMQKDLPLSATVKRFDWTSPHAWLQLMVKDETGNDVEWSIEMGPPLLLYRNGWRPNSVHPGDNVKVVIHPLRDGRPGGSMVSLTLPNGKQLVEMPPSSDNQVEAKP